MPWEIEFFEVERGSSPPRDFVLSLPEKSRARIARAVDLLEEFGPGIGQPYVKSIRGYGGLFELRVQSGRENVRLLFFHAGERLIVILHGFRKKSQAIAERDLRTASARMQVYREKRR